MVGANTFRALHFGPRPSEVFRKHETLRTAFRGKCTLEFGPRPSEVFRGWAFKALHRPDGFQKLLSIKDQTDYDRWLHKFAADLRKHWKRETGYEIAFPNLLMKGVCGVPEIPKATYDRLVRFFHVPLDSYSIGAVRNCIDARLQKKIGSIPRPASMGFVKTQEIYDGLQEAIRLLAKAANVPPIAFDDLAWDEAHNKKKRK
jgi:hypothetical protein